jgi:hypothetical protein
MLWSDKNPWLPGFVRGLLLAALGAVTAFLANASTDHDLPGWAIAMVPMALFFGRNLEALVLDQFRNEKDRMTPDV